MAQYLDLPGLQTYDRNLKLYIVSELSKINLKINKIADKLNITLDDSEDYDINKIIERLENLEATDFTTEDASDKSDYENI